MGFKDKVGFDSARQLGTFLTVVFSGQIVYSAFESLKVPFYLQLQHYYHLDNTQFASLYMMLGMAVFFYIPGGWVNNRFHVRDVLTWGLLYRLVTSLFMIIVRPAFPIMMVITFTWGVLDAIYWPAVVKGVVLFSGKNSKNTGLGALTALRAGGEALLNGILIAVMSLFGAAAVVFEIGMIAYACLTIPLVVLIRRYVPRDPDDRGHEVDDEAPASNIEALRGLIAALKYPKVWLAGVAGLTVYWVYTLLVYTTPFLTRVYGMGESAAATLATATAVILGLGGGLTGGIVADRVFKSASRTLAITLTGAAVLLGVMTVLPKGEDHLLLGVIVMCVAVFVILMAKGIQQAPVAELHLPSHVIGAAVSVNSFMCFSCILWAMPINGRILDAWENQPVEAFRRIFLILVVVALVGAAAALLLDWLNRRDARRAPAD